MSKMNVIKKAVAFLYHKWYTDSKEGVEDSTPITYLVNQNNFQCKKGVGDMYSAMNIARYIICECNNRNIDISNLKLQKLLYYAWIRFFARTKTKLFDDDICAWPFGPVVPEVYYKYRVHGGRPIYVSATECAGETISADDRVIINEILENLGRLSPRALVDMSHATGMPWDLTFRDGKGDRATIPFNLIIEKEREISYDS